MMFDRLPVYPYGIKVSLNWLQIAAHLDAIERFKIKLFVELGILEGGLTSVLLPGVKLGLFDYVGVELNKEYVNSRIATESHIIYGNCFNAVIRSDIKKIINNTTGPVLLFCDNGDKPREVVEYSPLLRGGDYITVHDYGTEIYDEHLTILDNEFIEVERSYRRDVVKMPLFRRL